MLLSLVIPVFNEVEVLPLTLAALTRTLSRIDCVYEIIFVDDGSVDGSTALIRAAAESDSRIKLLGFSRNFGHQAAVTAGLDFAAGDAVVVMDSDLQDTPELLPEMVELYRQGYDVVSPQRVSRKTDSLFKRWTASAFYWLMRKAVDARVLPEVGDFRLFSREAALAIRAFREQHRFMRGLVAWLGLREALVPFERRPRAAGETKYPVSKMVRFAWTAISSFSAMPLRVTTGCGLILTAFGALYALASAYQTLVLHATTPGWTSIISLQLLFSGMILAVIGLLGDYVARIYDEIKHRPLYVINGYSNIGGAPPGDRRVVFENLRREKTRSMP
jgi:dolichol-phosphate mannosyltransferase